MIRPAALALWLLATSASAQTRCLVEYTCRGHAPDSHRGAANIAGIVPVTQDEAFPLELPAAPVPSVTLSLDIEPARATADVAASAVQVSGDAELAVSPTQGGPTAAFRARMADPYRITGEDEVVAAWRYFEQEPAELAEEVRSGNAVIRMVQALGRAPQGGSLARPLLDDARKTATRARLRDGAVVVGRTAPWGAQSQTSYSGGTALELVPPASGVWFRLRSGEWISGLWLEFP